MLKGRGLFTLCALAIVAACLIGCGRQKQGLTLHFVFEDAKGITVGNKVMGDGVFVGQVIAPPNSPKPKHVVVSAYIDGLSADKMAYMTSDLTASIKKDSLVTGEVYLDLIFPKEPGTPIADGSILAGKGSGMGLADLSGVSIPTDPGQFIALLEQAFVSVDQTTSGATVFYVNWASVIVAILVVIALIVDLLFRLPQGSERERSSPRLLREAWSLFCLVLVIRVGLAGVRLLGGLGILGKDLLDAVRIGASDLSSLLSQEWPFWVLAIVLIALRFKFDLLMRARKG